MVAELEGDAGTLWCDRTFIAVTRPDLFVVGDVITLHSIRIQFFGFEGRRFMTSSENLTVSLALLLALAACRFDLPAAASSSGSCGDGIIDPDRGEVCDDGNARDGDGCSADCLSDESCGNGVLDIGEACDDGNVSDGDSCNPDCLFEVCGNRIVDLNEECDAGPEDSPGCNGDCTFVRCGDGHVNLAAGEECDANGQNTSACNGPLCKTSRCGDGFYNPAAGEQCDTGASTSSCDGDCTLPKCGDDYVNPDFTPPGASMPEQCDHGGLDTMACDADCTIPFCGDGYLNPAAGEACDKGLPQGGCPVAKMCNSICSACL